MKLGLEFVAVFAIIAFLSCADNITYAPTIQEICEDKELTFTDVQQEPYYNQYYNIWLDNACSSHHVGTECQSYNLTYVLKIQECYLDTIR